MGTRHFFKNFRRMGMKVEDQRGCEFAISLKFFAKGTEFHHLRHVASSRVNQHVANVKVGLGGLVIDLLDTADEFFGIPLLELVLKFSRRNRLEV